MNKTFGLGFLCLTLICVVLLSACGGGGETSAPTTQATTAPTTQQTSAPTTQQQQTTVVSSPYSDIPIYPGAKDAFGDYSSFTGSVASTFGDVDVEWHYYLVQESDPDNIIDYYESEMPDKGWDLIFSEAIPDMIGSYAMYMKGTDTATIMVFENPEGDDGLILAICKTSM